MLTTVVVVQLPQTPVDDNQKRWSVSLVMARECWVGAGMDVVDGMPGKVNGVVACRKMPEHLPSAR